MSELRECPFCAGEAEPNSETSWQNGERILRGFVACGSCHVRGPAVILDPYTNSFAKAEDEAIAAWNRRVDKKDKEVQDE